MAIRWHDDPLLVVTIGFYLAAIYNCYKVLSNRTTSGGAIAWILMHATMPFIAVPAYLLLGDFRIKGYVRRHRAVQRQLENAGAVAIPHEIPDMTSLPAALQPNYRTFSTVLRQFGPIFDPQHGTVELLVDGKDTFAAIFAAISNAKRYIIVQYYIVRSDRMGLELARLLSEKASSGVAVYMLYDDMGSFWLSRQYIRGLRKAGVKVERFLPIRRFKRFFQMNFRNHRKLVVVDGEVAFTGGLNVGEEYAARRSRKAKTRYWRDTHVRLTGDAIKQLEDGFFEDWYFSAGERVDLSDLVKSTHEYVPARPAAGTRQCVIQIVPTGPTDETVISLLFVILLINSANYRLWITTPYLVPDSSIARALELAALRGVDVRVILPRKSDNRLVQWVSLSYASELQTRGIKVLLYTKGFMHQKVILVDDSLAAIGTMNMDNRALYLNFETMVLVHDIEFNSQVAHMLERDFLSSRRLNLRSQTFWRTLEKLRGNAARLLAPLL